MPFDQQTFDQILESCERLSRALASERAEHRKTRLRLESSAQRVVDIKQAAAPESPRECARLAIALLVEGRRKLETIDGAAAELLRGHERALRRLCDEIFGGRDDKGPNA